MTVNVSEHFRQRMTERRISWKEVRDACEHGREQVMADGSIRYHHFDLVVVAENGQLVTCYTGQPRTTMARSTHPGFLAACEGLTDHPYLPISPFVLSALCDVFVVEGSWTAVFDRQELIASLRKKPKSIVTFSKSGLTNSEFQTLVTTTRLSRLSVYDLTKLELVYGVATVEDGQLVVRWNGFEFRIGYHSQLEAIEAEFSPLRLNGLPQKPKRERRKVRR